MLSSSQVQHKPRILKSLTGLTPTEFEALLPSVEQTWQDYIQESNSSTKPATVALEEDINLA